MTTREPMLDVLEQMTAELHRLNLLQTVHRSAYLLLVRHLAAQGHVRIDTLVSDLQTMGKTQPDAGWQPEFEELAAALGMLKTLPSTNQK